MRKLVTRFAKDEEGASLVEYGMLVGLIAGWSYKIALMAGIVRIHP